MHALNLFGSVSAVHIQGSAVANEPEMRQGACAVTCTCHVGGRGMVQVYSRNLLRVAGTQARPLHLLTSAARPSSSAAAGDTGMEMPAVQSVSQGQDKS